MHVIKPNALGISFRPMEYRGRFGLCVSGYLHVPMHQPAGGALWSEQSMWNFLATEMAVPMIDEGISKLTPEFLVHGYAFPDPVEPASGAVAVRARLADTEKTILAFGERRWDGDRISTPRAFERVALNWGNAYGGPEFAENPLGKGRQSVDGTWPLPQLEYPDSRLTHRRATIRPAGLGPLDPMSPQRAATRGTYDKAWLEQQSPGFASDLNWKHFNVAPSDQWLREPLLGEEAYALDNLHPTRPRIDGRLPGLKVRAFARRGAPGTAKLREIAMRLSTVWFFPHAERLVLVFHGVAECAEDDAGDIDLLLGAVERCRDDEARNDGHYLEAIQKRTESPDADLYSLIESDLVPEGLDTRDPGSEALADGMKPKGLKEAAVLRRAQADMQIARARASERGLDPDALGMTLPQREPQQTLEETAQAMIRQRKAMMDRQWELVDKMLAKAEALKARVDAGLPEDSSLVHRGPPVLSAASDFQAIDQTHTRANKPLDRGALRSMLAKVDLNRQFQYLHGAHAQAPALPLAGEAGKHKRDEVEWMLERGFRAWSKLDLTGVDLSGLDLRDVDLEGAWLESANLENCNLTRANFSSAVLANANLRGAIGVGANFEGANLGNANLERTVLDRSNLAGAILDKARIDRTDMRRTRLAGVKLLETSWEQVDWSEADVEGVLFHKLDLRQCNFSGANLVNAVFSECDLRGADFRGAQMGTVTFNACKADGSRYAGASLVGAVFSGKTTLSRADFSGALLTRVNFGDTTLGDSRWVDANLDDACLAGNDLARADLSGATLRRALLRKTVLREARLVGSNLMDAVMQRADLRGADLRDAHFFGADLSRVVLDREVKLDGAVLERARTFPRAARTPKAES